MPDTLLLSENIFWNCIVGTKSKMDAICSNLKHKFIALCILGETKIKYHYYHNYALI